VGVNGIDRVQGDVLIQHPGFWQTVRPLVADERLADEFAWLPVDLPGAEELLVQEDLKLRRDVAGRDGHSPGHLFFRHSDGRKDEGESKREDFHARERREHWRKECCR
jgi:hypothetical protein